jgi:tetratricopeptide (TPR) repeat protein
MEKIEDILKDLPEDLRIPFYKAFNVIKEESKELIAREEISKVWIAINNLTEAQKRTEESLESFKKSTEENFNKVWNSIKELAEAQKRTEKKVEELAEAQKNTEKTLKDLIIDFDDLKKQVGGITNTIGYTLENEAIKKMPKILLKKYNLKVVGSLKRGYLDNLEGKSEEINIFGEAKRNREKYFIIGECKSQLSKEDIDKIHKKFKRFENLYGKLFPIIVVHIVSSKDTEEYGIKKGIHIFYSFEL